MRNVTIATALFLLTAAVRAEDAAGQPYFVLQADGHTAAVRKVPFTPDGKRLISVSEDKTIRIWDAAAGERLGVLRPPVGPDDQGELRAAALSPDGATLAVGGVGYVVGKKSVVPIFLIDLAGGRVTATLQGAPNSAVDCLAFSHDGKLLAWGGDNGAAVLWDLNAGRVLHAPEGHKGAVHDLAFSPNDKLLATASVDRTARVWSVADGKDQSGPLTHKYPLFSVAWKDDDTLATGGANRAFIHLWDRTGKLLRKYDSLRPEAVQVESLAFLPGGKELFYVWTSSMDPAKELCQSGGSFLDLDNPEQSRDGYKREHPPTAVRGAVSPDGQWAVTSGGEGRINLWSIQDGKHLLVMRNLAAPPFQVYWGDQGAVVAWEQSKGRAAGADKKLARKAFDLDELRFLPRNGLKFAGAVHSRADCLLEQPGVRTVKVKRKDAVVQSEAKAGVQCYTLLSGDRVAVGAGRFLDLYDLGAGAPLRGFRGYTGTVWSVAPSPDGRYLLGAFSDHTLRIYDPDKEEPLLSLYVAGADWVAWTEQGYYAASPGGERLMGWQVNHGLEQLGTFYPAEQFHASLYRPDVIRRVLTEGSVEKALAAADKESGQTTEAVSVAQALPPEVKILAPAEGGVTLVTPELEVKASAVSKGRPVVSLLLRLDGRPFPGLEALRKFPDARAGALQEGAWKVRMPEGSHHLSGLAESAVSTAASGEVEVTYQPGPQEALPNLYVLAVGINAYPGGLKLDWAAADATAVAAAFKTQGAPRPYGKAEAKILLDKDATKAAILAGLDWLKQKMTGDDTAVVFYAGHGHRDRKTSQFYLLPVDVDPADLPNTGVTGTAIKDRLKAVPGRVLVLLDACHSGSIGQSPADPGSLTDDVQRQLAVPDCGVVVMCAAMAQEEAGEAAAVRHGFFTAALLSGLGGAAPRDRKDGLIHLTGLDYYVEQEVGELSKDEQHVVVDRPSTVTSFPLVTPKGKLDGR